LHSLSALVVVIYMYVCELLWCLLYYRYEQSFEDMLKFQNVDPDSDRTLRKYANVLYTSAILSVYCYYVLLSVENIRCLYFLSPTR